MRIVDVPTSVLVSIGRLGLGSHARGGGARPHELLRLYEFEACPFCRKVREALSILDLDAMIHPCPKGGSRFRPDVVERGGREQFPFLVDPNTNTELYESDDIIRYLFARYGDGRVHPMLSLGPLTDMWAGLSGIPRLGAGGFARPSREPSQPLELYSYEASPFSRLVREALCSLEIPYHLHNVAKQSAGRDDFVKRSGKMQVPWLSDPNTGTELFESADIVAYLQETYGA